jgi:hypothetical protein
MLDGPPPVGVAFYPESSQQTDGSHVDLAERVLRGAADRLDDAGPQDISGLRVHVPKLSSRAAFDRLASYCRSRDRRPEGDVCAWRERREQLVATMHRTECALEEASRSLAPAGAVSAAA